MQSITVNGKKVKYSRFTSRQAAHNYAGRGDKRQWVVLGDVGQFWICRPVDAGRLERAGYELDRFFNMFPTT